MNKLFIIVCAVAVIASVFGCSTPTTAFHSAATNVSGALTSAATEIAAAVPHADPVGQAHLQDASGNIAVAQKQVPTLEAAAKKVDTLTAQNTVLLQSWGHRLQVFVTAAFWILVALAGLHVALAAASFLLPIVFPAAAVAVPVLSLVARIINPLGWFTWLASRAHTSDLMRAAAAPAKN